MHQTTPHQPASENTRLYRWLSPVGLLRSDPLAGRFRRPLALVGLVLATTGLTSVILVEPKPGGIFPPCPFRLATGLKCPGCGSLRALHALGHGDLASAWHLNPALVVGLPVLGWTLAQLASVALRGRPLRGLVPNRAMTLAIAAALLGWGIARNIV